MTSECDVIEEGPLADWLYRNLSPRVDEMVVCDPHCNALKNQLKITLGITIAEVAQGPDKQLDFSRDKIPPRPCPPPPSTKPSIKPFAIIAPAS